jgi:hypothetical protein
VEVRYKARQSAEQGRLPRARRPEEGNALTVLDPERHGAERPVVTVRIREREPIDDGERTVLLARQAGFRSRDPPVARLTGQATPPATSEPTEPRTDRMRSPRRPRLRIDA